MSYRDDLSLLFYFLWDNNIRHSEIQYANQASSAFGTLDNVKQDVRFTDKHLGRSAEVIVAV